MQAAEGLLYLLNLKHLLETDVSELFLSHERRGILRDVSQLFLLLVTISEGRHLIERFELIERIKY
jgi:hypothetical protein